MTPPAGDRDPAHTPVRPVRVLLCDDHAVVRAGLLALLSSAHGIEVIGEAGDGEEAVALAAALRPDVVLMDLHSAPASTASRPPAASPACRNARPRVRPGVPTGATSSVTRRAGVLRVGMRRAAVRRAGARRMCSS